MKLVGRVSTENEQHMEMVRVGTRTSAPVHAGRRKANMRLVGVTIFSANGNSWDADEIEASPQGDEI